MTEHTPTCPICHQDTQKRLWTLHDRTTRVELIKSQTICGDCMTDLGRHMETMQRAMREVPRGWK